jgi:hypothetical protein
MVINRAGVGIGLASGFGSAGCDTGAVLAAVSNLKVLSEDHRQNVERAWIRLHAASQSEIDNSPIWTSIYAGKMK